MPARKGNHEVKNDNGDHTSLLRIQPREVFYSLATPSAQFPHTIKNPSISVGKFVAACIPTLNNVAKMPVEDPAAVLARGFCL
jgi:hypothetical protein